MQRTLPSATQTIRLMSDFSSAADLPAATATRTHATLVLQGPPGGQALVANNTPGTSSELHFLDVRHTGFRFVIKAGPTHRSAVVFERYAVWAPFQRFERLWEVDMQPYFKLSITSVLCFANTCATAAYLFMWPMHMGMRYVSRYVLWSTSVSGPALAYLAAPRVERMVQADAELQGLLR